MSQISIVKLSEVEKDGRFDAEFYKPEYLEVEKILKKFKDLTTIKEISEVITNGHTPRYADLTQGEIKFLTAENIFDLKINYDETKFIFEKPHLTELKRTIIKEGDILVTIKGKIGNFAVVNFDPKKKYNINQDVGRIKLKKGFNQYYISAFLNSIFGKWQSSKFATGQINPFLGLGNLEKIKIPLLPQPFQEKIETLVKDSYSKLQTSKSLYKEAEEILLKELNLESYKPKHELTFGANLKEVLEAERIDADYFQPKYKEIEKRIEKFETLTLTDKEFFKIITGTYSEKYSDKGTNYIRSVDVQDNLLVELDNLYKTEEKLDNKIKVKEGDIITSRVGSIGTLGYIHKELEGSFISDNILRIRNLNKNLNSLFLSFYLKKIGTIFMERLSRGSVQQRLNQETLKEIKIPLLLSPIQNKISEKIQESFKLRKESKELLEKAKKMVEDEIEKEASK